MVIGFTQAVFSEVEDDEMGSAMAIQVCMGITGQLDRDVLVFLSTSDGSAKSQFYTLYIILQFS